MTPTARKIEFMRNLHGGVIPVQGIWRVNQVKERPNIDSPRGRWFVKIPCCGAGYAYAHYSSVETVSCDVCGLRYRIRIVRPQ